MNEDNVENSLLNMSLKYDKISSAGVKGGLFQINLLTMFMLNAIDKIVNWRLSTENKSGAKFDDIIFESSNEVILLQAKYKQKASFKITDENLFSTNSKKDDFSLAKYFFSYKEVRRKFKNVKNVIICTNVDLAVDKIYTIRRALTIEDMLYFGGSNEICHTFQDSIISRLEESARLYEDKNLKNKNMYKDIISKEDIRDFLKHLHFISNYPSDNDLRSIIEDKISRSAFGKNLNYTTASTFIFHEMMAWYVKDKGIYMDPISSKSIFCKMVSYKFCEYLERYEVFFENNNFIARNGKKIIHVIPDTENLLYIIKIYRSLLQSETLFVPSTEETDIQLQIIDVFNLIYCKYLVIIRSKANTQNDDEITSKIKDIISNKGKRVILIAQKEDAVAKRLKETCNTFYCQRNYHIVFSDFTEVTKKKFLGKIVNFQGEDIDVRTLLPTSDSRNHVLNCDILAKLVKGETISIGKKIEQLDSLNYISRTIHRHKVRGLVETDILKEKITLISASAGMGKSTVLKKIGTVLKKDCPHLWVIPVDLNCCTKVLKRIEIEDHIDIAQLLDCQEIVRLQNEVEKALFLVPNKVALMIDGVDEISPYYTDTVLKILTECKDKENFIKIIVTTRPHLQKELEYKLEQKAWDLIPFTGPEQIQFLQHYWSKNLNIQNTKLEDKCKYYAMVLVNNVSNFTNANSRESFAGNPLQTRMLAEVFQEKTGNVELEEWEYCREFVLSSNIKPKLPKKINFVRLYQMFIEKKRKIFIEEKGNPNGNVISQEALIENFKRWYAFHHILALKDIVGNPYLSLFTSEKVNQDTDTKQCLLKLGIVEMVNFNLRFVHRTFAEYFVAESTIKELKCNNTVEFYNNYLFTLVFSSTQYITVRMFLNDFLKGEPTLLIRTNSIHYTSMVNVELCLHTLARENCANILHFICTNFSFSKQKGPFKLPYRNRHVKFNVDSMDTLGRTALNIAASMGHMESVKCLIQQGANVDNSDCHGDTPLIEAVRGYHFNIVTYLVEKGADVNCRNNENNTPLLEVSKTSYLNIAFRVASFLIEKGADPNIRSNSGATVLQYLVSSGLVDLVERVLEVGTQINERHQLQGTALHIAVNSRHVAIIKLLLTFGADVNAINEGNWVVGGRLGWDELHRNQYIARKNEFVYDHMGGFTPLHLAVAQDDLESSRILIEHNACVNAIDRCGCTPLHVAVRKGNLAVVDMLLLEHADPNIQDKYGRTALHEACCYSDFSSYSIRRGKTPLIHGPRFDIVKNLVTNGANVNCRDKHGNTPLLEACIARHFAMAWFLINKGAQPNIRNNFNSTVLQGLVSGSNRKLIQRVLDMGVEINVKKQLGGTALHIAVNSGNVAIVKLLLKRGADVNAVNEYDWVFGIDRKWNELHRTQNIVCKDKTGGFTPLHLAVALDKLKLTRMLLEYADVDVTDGCGCTPLHIAVRKNNLWMAQILLKKQANPNLRDICGRTALHEATFYTVVSPIMYDFLVSCGTDHSIEDDNGKTPFDEIRFQ